MAGKYEVKEAVRNAIMNVPRYKRDEKTREEWLAEAYPDVGVELSEKLLAKPISMGYSEYELLRRIAACSITLDRVKTQMTGRLKEIPYAKRDISMIEKRFKKLLHEILLTVPRDKMLLFAHEMDSLAFYVTCNLTTMNKYDKANEYCVLWRDDVNALCQMLIDRECVMCDKDEKQIRRCKVRKAIDKMMPFAQPLTIGPDRECPLNGMKLADVETDDWVAVEMAGNAEEDGDENQ